MARTLPLGLAAKISASGQQPEIAVTVQDLVTRLTSFASGGTSGRSSAILSATGTIIRAVVAQAASTNQTITVQTITPATPSSWTQTPVTVTTNAVARAGCCLVQTAGTTRLFYQRTADSKIVYRDSTDDGLTWGAETLTVNATGGGLLYCYGIAADTTTSILTAWAAFDPNGVANMYRSTYSSSWSAWHAEGPSTPAWGQIRGMAVVTQSGTRRYVSGAGMRGYISGISATWFTWDGASTYSAMSYLQQLDSPAQGLSCSYPDLFYDPSNVRSDGLQWYAAVTLTDDGSVSTSGHTRTTIYRSPDGSSWQPWLAAGTALQYGAHVIITGGETYIFDAATCYTVPASPAPIDLSDDLLDLEITERYNQPAEISITLANQSGQYTAAPWLVDNATITIALGYGGQTVTTHLAYLDDYTISASPTEKALRIAARGPLKLLDYPSTLLLAYSNQTVAQIATAICSQAQVPLAAIPATTQFSQTVPCLMITPGETWLSALNRLANVYGFIVTANAGPQVILTEPALTDPSSWSYGAEVEATDLGTESNRPNVVRVTGATTTTTSVWSEATDRDNILLVGAERYLLIVDRMLDTSARCQIRAGLELRRVQREAGHGIILAAINPQHELGDVITYTDAAIGATNQSMRISEMRWTAAPERGVWQHALTLENP